MIDLQNHLRNTQPHILDGKATAPKPKTRIHMESVTASSPDPLQVKIGTPRKPAVVLSRSKPGVR